MKARVFLFALFCLIGGVARAATLTWANTNGGDWNIATNWSPNQVPLSGDDVIITNGGTYAVTNTSSATLGNLVLGGTNGTQTLILASLTLTNAGLVNSNAILNWNGGEIDGRLTVAQGGVLNITNSATYYFYGLLTNSGTVNWSGGSLYGLGPPSYNGLIYNAGLWNAQFDGLLTVASGAPAFINTGTFRKSAGTGTTTISWNFTSTGTFDVQTGSLSISTWTGNSTLHGVYTGSAILPSDATLTVATNAILNWNGGEIDGGLTVAQGGVLNITNSATYYIQGSLTNNGTVSWSAGNIYGLGPPTYTGIIYNAGLWDVQFDGALTLAAGAPVFLNVGTFRKSAGTSVTTIGWNFTTTGIFDIQTGSLSVSTWTSNSTLHGIYTGSTTLSTGATLTVATNAILNWNGGEIDGVVTVAQGGVLNITNNTTYYVVGSLTNNGTVNWSAGNIYGYGPPTYNGLIYNAGLWDAQFDGTLALAAGTPAFINAGTFRKSAGTGVTTISWNFTTTGTFDIQTGSLAIPAWVGNSTVHGNYTGAISVNTNTTITVPASVTLNWTGGNIAAGGVLNVNSNAVVNWGGGEIDGVVTVAQGGVLNITNNATYYIAGSLTNNGTVNWSAGNFYGYGPPTYNGLIYNAGLWNAQFDGTFALAAGTPLFLNPGTFRKSGGTGIMNMGWNFTSTGAFDTQTGSLSVSTWTSNSTLHGVYTGSAILPIGATLTVATNAILNWNGGEIDGGLAVAQGGALNITNNATYYIQGSLTNNGTVSWSAGNIYGLGPPTYTGLVYNAGLWDAQFDGTLTIAAGTPVFLNAGTFRKSAGIGTTAINWNFTNSTGILDAQTNILSLAGSYDLSGGTLNVGINSPGNNGVINLSGSPAGLTGTLRANLNQGYVPATGSSFNVLTYSSWAGTFTNFNLPFPVAWQTNYGSTVFTLTVLNVRPTLAAIANRTVDELTLLTVTNGATDPDSGQLLTFSLVSPPAGMTINSSSGTISWTPAQTQSPSTNLILVSVTDNGTPVLSATNSFNAIVREVNVPPSPPALSTQNVDELTLLTVTNTATNFNIHSTISGYALVNPPSNMVVNAGGIITWTPAQTQSPSTNVITAIVTNSNPYDLINPRLTSTNTFTVIVREINDPPSLPTIPTQTVNELTLLTVANTATNFNIHSFITGYTLVNPLSNMVVNAGGIITWTPAQTQSPSTNVITTIVTNSNPYDLVNPRLTSTNTFTVIVREVNVAPVLSSISPQTFTLLRPSSFTNSVTEPNIHSVTTGYSLLAPPAGAVIDNSGVITWTPPQNRALTTNTITTVVTNNNPYDLVNPHLTSTNSFSIIVVPNLAPTNFTTLNAGGTSLTFNWPPDHTGWRLEIQTNSHSTGIGTNWTTFAGSSATNQETITIVPTNGSVFFRMAYP